MFLRDRRELSDKLLTLLTIGFGIPLSGVERLFLSRNPSFRNSFQIWGKLLRKIGIAAEKKSLHAAERDTEANRRRRQEFVAQVASIRRNG